MSSLQSWKSAVRVVTGFAVLGRPTLWCDVASWPVLAGGINNHHRDSVSCIVVVGDYAEPVSAC